MDERNSMKLDIETIQSTENEQDQPTESYKQVSEFNSNGKSSDTPAMSTENVGDGADEKMLAGDEKEQLARKDEVKFIACEKPNGDAKIDIGCIDKGFSGMTKEELMKYANDPFWRRLRWTFFILFWLLWVLMLAGAIWIIFKAPKCSAAKPLAWFKEGPLVEMEKSAFIKPDARMIEKLKSVDAKGVIYQLPADKTYSLNTVEVQDYVKQLVEGFKDTNISVVLDLTPNYVTTENALYKAALQNESARSAFVWVERTRTPNNWLSKVPNNQTNGTAWQLAKTNHYVVSQFGENNIDLQLNDPIAKEEFKQVLRELVRMGVKGFRLANAKHYIIDRSIPDDKSITANTNTILTDYDFWYHAATTNQPGIGALLHEFWQVVNNETNGEGFLSVTDYIDRPEVFTIGDKTIGFDLPIVVNLTLPTDNSSVAKRLKDKLTNAFSIIGRDVWLQWPYEKLLVNNAKIGSNEYNIFLFLLPGVPVGKLDDFVGTNNATVEEFRKLQELRKTASYQHGSFDVYTGNNDTIIAYTRLKTGNPGYFVVYNPLEFDVTVDFSSVKGLPEQLTIDLASKPYENATQKVHTNAIPLQGSSAVIFTYAPKSA